MYTIIETRKVDFESDELIVHRSARLSIVDARADARRALGRSCRDAIRADMVDNPRDVDFDLSDPDRVTVDGCGWSTVCEIHEVECNDVPKRDRSWMRHMVDRLIVRNPNIGEREVRRLLRNLFDVDCIPYEGGWNDHSFSITFKVTEETDTFVINEVGESIRKGHVFPMDPNLGYLIEADYKHLDGEYVAIYNMDIIEIHNI